MTDWIPSNNQMRPTAVAIALSVLTTPAVAQQSAIESWRCKAGAIWELGGDIVVTAFVNEGGTTGRIEVANVAYETSYRVDGFNRRWDFGPTIGQGLKKFAFVIEVDNLGKYYDADQFGGTSPSALLICRQDK